MKKWGKRLLRAVVWLALAAALSAPLVLIYRISTREIAQYAAPKTPEFVDTSYGEPTQARRTDVEESISVSGVFVPCRTVDMELTMWEPDLIRWDVSPGEEVTEGQQIGTWRGQPVTSPADAILESCNIYGAAPYVRFVCMKPVELECQLGERALAQLQAADTLTTQKGESAAIVFVSQRKSPEGLSTVRISIDSDRFTCGQTVEDLQLLTGRVFQGALVLNKNCVYQKEPGENSPWYARQVTADGVVIGEIPVSLGYEVDKVICVTGVQEGQYFDSAYGAVAEARRQG